MRRLIPFVADGSRRIRRSPEFQAKLHALRVSVEARYAKESANIGPIGRLRLRYRMTLTYWRERRQLMPSPHSLYAVRS